MKKLLASLFAAAMFVGMFSAGAASADPVCTDGGCVTVAEGGYIVAADGDESNPDPLDGYISVSDGGQICASDEGAPGDPGATCGP